MSSNSLESSENVCVVCFKNVEIYSIGSCDHMICYECSTRMRVLCRQNECPICRQDLPEVVFLYSIKPFSTIVNSAPYEDKQFKIHFQDKKIKDAFYKLLEHTCSVCPNKPSFPTFQNLNGHMKKEHELFYCDLCVENLKIFTSERRCYNKNDLLKHERKGDRDDKSHRGHPLCEFCKVRYMDNDFLYRHLRQDHLFCPFCDADGQDLYYSAQNRMIFFSSYVYLHEHFREKHYLCEERTCFRERLTPVFNTEIEFKAHKMFVHGRSMGKAEARQARTLQLEFKLKPRLRRQENGLGERSYESFSVDGASSSYELPPPRMSSPTLDPSEFPSLPSGSGSVTVSAPQRKGRSSGLTIQAMGRRNAPLAITDENFPVLGEYNDNAQGTSVRLNINQDRGSSNGRTGSVMTQRNVSIHVNHRANGEQNIRIRQDDFPALPSDSTDNPVPAAKWVSVTNKKSQNQAPKQPKPPKPPLQAGDFPDLNAKFNMNLNLKANEPLKPNYVNLRSSKGEGKNAKKASSVVIPVRSDWSDVAEAGTSSSKPKTKKKKSKGSSSEERSDTAKKKDEKDTHSAVKGNSNNVESESSALIGNSSNSSLVKPLPTAENWFGDTMKSLAKAKCEEKEEDDDEEERESEAIAQIFNSVKNGVTSEAVKLPKSPSKGVKSGGSSSKGKDSGAGARRVGTKAPPPGFDCFNGCGKGEDTRKPPPGFSFSFPSPNGLTFTNSSGQSYAIPSNYIYIPPLDSEKRNQNLVSKVVKILVNEGTLDKFKSMSALFRQDMLSADDYFNQCIKTIGEDDFREIFPEMLILLPDINKQQELFQVLTRSAKFNAEKASLQACKTCRQVLCVSDIKEHIAQHALQENFSLLMYNN